MSIKRTIEISNSESDKEEYEKKSLYISTSEWINSYVYSLTTSLDTNILRMNVMYYFLIILWILFSFLSINESLKCENKVIYIILSLVPFVNFILYFSIYNNLICLNSNVNVNVNRNVNRDGVGFLNSIDIYPSEIFKKKTNNNKMKPKNTYNKYTNRPTNIPRNRSTNRPTNIPRNRSTNIPTNRPTNIPTNIPRNRSTNRPTNRPTNMLFR
jgi:hypothetical protein